ncbi:MAG: four helix bundle protein [bacterium]|nr:four helix bundle protein [bacterium]
MWNYSKLEVWQRSREFVRSVYEETGRWPSDERFGLVSQARRASVSIGANLAEGSGRGTYRAYAQFVGHAIGSLNELEHHLVIADDVGFIDPDVAHKLHGEAAEIGRMLHALRAAILRSGGSHPLGSE